MSKSLVIVESPTKAKTISKFLPKDFVVESTIGHIRDLPSSAKDIPPSYKDKDWARLGIDVANGFQPLYVVPAEKKKQVAKLKQLIKGASTIYLATDEDREGESISWHVVDLLKPKVPRRRPRAADVARQPAADDARRPAGRPGPGGRVGRRGGAPAGGAAARVGGGA